MKTTCSKWAVMAALFCGVTAMQAQTYTYVQPSGVKVVKAEAERDRKSGQAFVRIEFDLGTTHVNSNHSLVLQPVIMSPNGPMRELPRVVINGRKRSIIRKRQGVNELAVYQAVTDTTVRRYNRKAQSVSYRVALPFEAWMTRSNIIVREQVMGCADCQISADDCVANPLLTGVFAPTYPERFYTSTMMPAAELRKERSEKFAATFTYRVNRTELVRDYADNARKLAEVDTVIATIKAKPNATVSYIDIVGYASPEGSAEGNVRLSKGRAEAFQKYLMDKHGLSRSQMRVNWYGSDWDGLLAVLDKGDVLSLEDCSYIAGLIRTSHRDDKMRKQLINYKYGVPYKALLENVYPALRRNEYTVSYSVGLFDLEQARRVIHTHPDLMSLHEMYTVASSYPKGSAENKAALEVAYRFFPHAVENRVNRSERLIEAGEYSEALRLLEGVNTPEADNNRGVCYAKQEKATEALVYFERAAKAGNPAAATNLKELQDYLSQ